MPQTRQVLPAIFAVLLFALCSNPTRAQVADPTFPFTNGRVEDLAVQGDTLYVGGSFTSIGWTRTGPLAILDAGSGTRTGSWPPIAGVVRAIVADGSGGWFIGGQFTAVAGIPRNNLARLRGDGTLDGWNPDVTGAIDHMTLSNDSLFIIGAVSAVGGQARQGLAGFDEAGTLLAWNPTVTGATRISVLQNTVYIGGTFGAVNGVGRSRAAAIDRSTGSLLPWNPAPNGAVNDIVATQEAIYVGGTFNNIAAQFRNGFAPLDPTTAALLPWAAASLPVQRIAVSAGLVYLAFDQGGLRAYQEGTGVELPWISELQIRASAIAIADDRIFIGSEQVYGSTIPQQRLVAIDAITGAVIPWNSGANAKVFALAVQDDKVVAGGSFSAVDCAYRPGFAAFRKSTREVLPWNITLGIFDGVTTIVPTPSTVFLSVSGATGWVIAFDRATGTRMSPWQLGSINAGVECLAVTDSIVYTGGPFSGVNTGAGLQPRSGLAAFRRANRELLPWNPGVGNGYPGCLATDHDRLYVGGGFTTMAGTTRTNLGAFNLQTGLLDPWDPAPDLNVYDLIPAGGTIFAGGFFSNVGAGVPRARIAELDSLNGTPTSWSPPAPDHVVRSLALDSGTVFAGGGFSTINGDSRLRVAAFDRASAALLPWNPGINAAALEMRALEVDGSDLYAGGTFTSVAGVRAGNLARIVDDSVYGPIDVLLTSPDGGSTMLIGDPKSITWSAEGGVGDVQFVNLFLSRTGPGGPWELLAGGVPNTGEYTWKVTGPITPDAFVKVAAWDAAEVTAEDISNDPSSISDGVTGIETPRRTLSLFPPAPNPIGRAGTISFTTPRDLHVHLSMIDVQGRTHRVMVDGMRPAGRQSVPIDVSGIAPGLYFLKLRAGSEQLSRRFAVVH